MQTTNIGIIGFGTVGSGTVRIILENSDLIKERTGIKLNIKGIADLDIKTDRGIKLPKGTLVSDANKLIEDPEIDIIIELIGGTGPAKDLILAAIDKGKHVVTANKALLATDGNELFSAAQTKGVYLGFEASVAGGIPIIKVLKEGLSANRILSVYGIINGTSNYILTRMSEEKVDFDAALKEAQELGYAEADPTFDIEGIDTAHKLALISSLVYGIPLSYEKIYCEGISKISTLDIEFAAELGYKIKLLAITKISDGDVEMRVHPTMVPVNYMIAKVDGVFNAIYVEGDAVGETLYYGRGAGDMPTGSAVVSDIIDIAMKKGSSYHDPLRPYGNARIKSIDDIESNYYFRFTALDKPGVLSRVSGILGSHGISIASVIQKGRREGEAVPLVVLTHKSRESNVKKAISEIDGLDVVSGSSVVMRVEGDED
ncbi:MAG: homoserine dehydrogenase [Nitrospirota bacterium]|nr:MAG: homoserine dehydrogenase [Nitrospirota bacterium]